MNKTCIRLKKLRKKHNLSQKQVARHLGIPQQTYSNYERDIREIPSSHIARLACFYHVSTDYLLGVNTAKANQYYLDTPFIQGISFRDIIYYLLQLEPPNRKALIQFLASLRHS